MLKLERQDEIVKQVWQRGTASIVDLAALLGVSEMTVRRDLDELGAEGRLQRIRGGARRPHPTDPEPTVVQRELQQQAEKRAIAQAALDLVPDATAVAITAGSTTLELARTMAGRTWHNLQVVTNSLTIINELLHVSGVRLTLVAGGISPEEMGTFGPLTEHTLKRLNVDRLFIGCRGIDPRAGLTHDEASAVTTDQAFVAAARQVIVLADHSKFGRNFLMQIIPIEGVDVVVTDNLAPEDLLEELRRQDIQVIVAPPLTTSGE